MKKLTEQKFEFMDKNISQKKLLFDIKTCITNIENYVSSTKNFTLYDKNILIQDAVERNLITIGEAINILLKLIPEIKISNVRRIVNARNKLTHGYDEIENMQIWNIIIKHIPILKKEIEHLLDE